MFYRCTGVAKVLVGMTVDASSKEEALEIANEEFGELRSYVGMGGTDKLVGVSSSEDDRFVVPDAEAEFTEAEELE